MTKEELIEIMSDEEDEDFQNDCKCEILDGLKILSKYTRGSVVLGAAHDLIFSISVSVAIKKGMTREEAKQLRVMNWMLEKEGSCFATFV